MTIKLKDVHLVRCLLEIGKTLHGIGPTGDVKYTAAEKDRMHPPDDYDPHDDARPVIHRHVSPYAQHGGNRTGGKGKGQRLPEGNIIPDPRSGV